MNKLINSSDTVFATFSKCTLEIYMRAHADSSLVLCEFSFFALFLLQHTALCFSELILCVSFQ